MHNYHDEIRAALYAVERCNSNTADIPPLYNLHGMLEEGDYGLTLVSAADAFPAKTLCIEYAND